MLESLFKKVAGLKACNFIKKRPEHRCFPVNIAKFLILLNSKNNCERLLFDFYNGSLLHQPHRSSFLFLSWYDSSMPPPTPPPALPAFENLRRIPLMNQLSFYIGYFWLF